MPSLKEISIVLLLCASVALGACERRPVDQVAAMSAAREPPPIRSEMQSFDGTNMNSSGSSSTGTSNRGSDASSAQEDCAPKNARPD